MVTMEHKKSKPTVHLTHLNLNNFKLLEAMGLKNIGSRPP
jgi:hypothetical protein